MATWTIEFYDVHGTYLQTFEPMNLGFDHALKEVGSITFDLARSDPRLTRDLIGPYRTDYFLKRNSTLIQSGVITSYEWSSGDEGVVHFAGKDWLQLLDKRIMYFDPTLTHEAMMTNAWIKQAIKRHEQIVDAVFTRMNATVGSTASDPVWSLNPSPATFGGGTINWESHPFDTSTVLSIVQDLADDEARGFDFEARYTGYSGGRVRLTLDMWNPLKDQGTIDTLTYDEIVSLSFTNEGPMGTRIWGVGDGTGTTSLGSIAPNYQPSIDLYRTHDSVHQLGAIRYRDRVNSLTAIHGKRDRGPHKILELRVDADSIPNFWVNYKVGRNIWVDYDFLYHRVDSLWRILGYTAEISLAGDEEVTLQLERLPDDYSG